MMELRVFWFFININLFCSIFNEIATASKNDNLYVEPMPYSQLSNWQIFKKLVLYQPILGINTLYIYRNGLVSFDKELTDSAVTIPTTTDDRFISLYYHPDIRKFDKSFYKETNKTVFLERVAKDVRVAMNKEFTPKSAVFITYGETSKDVFQLVLIAGETEHYAVVSYASTHTRSALAGYSVHGSCKFNVFAPLMKSVDLMSYSNTNVKGRLVYELSSRECNQLNFTFKGKTQLVQMTGDSIQLQWKQKIPMFNGQHNSIHISSNGYISISQPINKLISAVHIKRMTTSFLYIGDMISMTQATIRLSDGDTSTSNAEPEIWSNIIKDISVFNANTFAPTFVYPMEVNYNNSMEVKLVIASDGKETFVVLDRQQHVNRPFVFGYSSKNCDWFLLQPEKLVKTGNTGYLGQYIFNISTKRCMHDVMQPYGEDEGDIDIGNHPNTLYPLKLKKPIPFFSLLRRHLYLSRNGFISLYRQSDPSTSKDGNTIFNGTLLVFSHKPYLRGPHGSFFYRETSESTSLNKISKLIQRHHQPKSGINFTCNHALIITFDHVQESKVAYSQNTFQVILATDGTSLVSYIHYFSLDTVDILTGWHDLRCCPNIRDCPTKQLNFRDDKTAVQLLTDSKCTFETLSRGYFPYGTEHGDTLLTARSNVSTVRIDLNSTLSFGNAINTKTLYISKYGFVSFENDTMEKTVWIPHPTIAFITGLGTHIPSDLYYRLDKNPKKTWQEKFGNHPRISKYEIKQLLVMTFKTPSDINIDQNALDYQFVIADDDGFREVRTFVRVDTEYGIRGFNIPGCNFNIQRTAGLTSGFEIVDDSSTTTLGQRVVPNYFRCGTSHPENFLQYGPDDKIHTNEHPFVFTLQTPIFLIDPSRKTNSIQIDPKGSFRDAAIETGRNFENRYDIFYKISLANSWQNGDAIFYREDNRTETLQAISALMYKHTNYSYTVRHAVIITSARSFYRNVYQVIVMTDGVTTYALSFFIDLPIEYGNHGIDNQFCEGYTKSWYLWSNHLYDQKNKFSNLKGVALHRLTHKGCVRVVTTTTTTTTTTSTTSTTTTTTTTSTTKVPTTGMSTKKNTIDLTSRSLNNTSEVDDDDDDDVEKSGVSMGVIIGASVGVPTIFIAFILVFIMYTRKRQKRRNENNKASFSSESVTVDKI